MTYPLPMTVVSGYLGAGKTTLVNRLLSMDHGLRITVLVNDFGAIALDENLILNSTGDTIALKNGCVCCTIGGDLYDAIDRILSAAKRPDHLVIEASGVADPNNLAQIAHAEPDLKLGRIITLVDSLNFARQMGNPLIRDSLERQIRVADPVIISKTDLTDEYTLAALQEEVAGLCQSGTSLIKAPAGYSADLLLGNELSEGQLTLGDSHDHNTIYKSASWRWRGVIDPRELQKASEPSISGVYRLKGLIVGIDGEQYEVHRVGSRWTSQLSTQLFEENNVVIIGLAERLDTAPIDKLMTPLAP